MATPILNGAREIALNKPDPFNVDRNKFKEFLQSVVYIDVNHKVYRTDLIKIAFVLLFMNSGLAATWKYQFIDEKMKLPPPANPNNNKLRQYVNFRKDLVSAFLMFDSVGNALDRLWALIMRTGSSIEEHIARFKLLAAATEIDLNHALTIELFKEMLQPAL